MTKTGKKSQNLLSKKILLLLVTFSMVCALIPVNAFAQDEMQETHPATQESPATLSTEDTDVEVESEEQLDDDAETLVSSSSEIAPISSYATSEVTDDDVAKVLGVLEQPVNAPSMLSLNDDSSAVQTYAGDTMFETAVAEAEAAYPNGSTTAIIVGPGDAWVDALSAAGLAATRGPILFTWQDRLHEATAQALVNLGVKTVVVVGGTAAVSDQVVSDLAAYGISLDSRLWGEDCYGTQASIYQYGLEHGCWNDSLAIVATGAHYGDALSVSPVAYAERAPIFLVDATGSLPAVQSENLAQGSRSGKFSSIAIIGGVNAVSERTEGFISGVVRASKGSYERIAGATQYETSAEVANWAISKRGFSWNNAAFTTGTSPYDALAGSVLQGATRSVLLLVSEDNTATVSVAKSHKETIHVIRFFGGTNAVSSKIRAKIIFALSDLTSYQDAGITLDRMTDLEYESVSGVTPSLGYTKDEIRFALDPDNCDYGDDDFYQFAVLDGGYSNKVNAVQLDAFIDTYGADGMLAGKGQAFIDAAKQYGVNEVYLLAHAILESGWGSSALAQGWLFSEDIKNEKGEIIYKATGKTYYNFFGIGAYDPSPLSGGRLRAYQQDWSTPEKAIIGAAEWVSKGANGSGRYFQNEWHQNTLYKMRWNFSQAASDDSVWKQYATSKTWATGIARVMAQCYRLNNIDKAETGLKFSVPRYR